MGTEYRAIRVADGTVLTSINIKAQSHASTARSLIAEPDTKSNAAAVSFVAEHCSQDGSMLLLPETATSGQIADLRDPTDANTAAMTTLPLVQQVGNAPGHGGSRASLRRRATPLTAGARRNEATSKPSIREQKRLDTYTARALVKDARKAGLILRWRPGHTKHGQSGERYQFYSKTKTFAQFDALTKDFFLSGHTGTMKPRAVSSDLAYDVAHGILTFVDADTVPVQPAGQDTLDASDNDSVDDDMDTIDNDTAMDPSAGMENVGNNGQSSPANDPPPGHGRYPLRRRRAARAAIANVKKALTPDERKLLLAGLEVKAASAYIGVPDAIMMAAKVRHDRVHIPKTIGCSVTFLDTLMPV